MNLALKPEMKRLIEDRLRTGRYASAEDVVQAGLAALQQQETAGDFAAGEMQSLMEEGERSIRREGTVEAAKVFARLRRKSQQRPSGKG
jgi:putative addiction module CopG family antidote